MIDRPAQRRVLLWSAITAVLMVVSLFGIFFVAPTDGDQGIIQKIFYFHVADAMAALIIFAVAAVSAILYLRTRKERYDEITTVSIGVGLVYSILVVITGSLWAKASWG
ncbi:MAG TPA: cytochrome c biogenesis protein CcsA, partial [Miltoncostaeaceae bacterium]|nr:cytochrome c biogenesis protein CcsA [Miltoncostaeaceae bacterium]